MITVRSASERGKTKLAWLDSKHTFSFADYYDNKHIHFGPLRVINEDIVAAGQGFGAHSHKDMEIITYVIAGALEHKDSIGTGAVIRSGEVQRMSAGKGVTHSEFNHSKTEPVYFLQIWVIPEIAGISAEYEQKKFDLIPNQWHTIANLSGSNGALKIHQDIILLAAKISAGQKLSYSFKKEGGWLQVVKGAITTNDINTAAGDGLSIVNEPNLELTSLVDSEVLLFDLPLTGQFP